MISFSRNAEAGFAARTFGVSFFPREGETTYLRRRDLREATESRSVPSTSLRVDQGESK